jgi:hypothetical protein
MVALLAGAIACKKAPLDADYLAKLTAHADAACACESMSPPPSLMCLMQASNQHAMPQPPGGVSADLYRQSLGAADATKVREQVERATSCINRVRAAGAKWRLEIARKHFEGQPGAPPVAPNAAPPVAPNAAPPAMSTPP